MIKKLLAISTTVILLALSVFTTPVAADTRCGGDPGVQVWENANKGGGTTIFCWGSRLSQLQIPRLSAYTDGLGFGATWHDRISSAQTFNFKVGAGIHRKITFWADDNYSAASVGGRVVEIIDNDYISCFCNAWDQQIPGGYNDRIDSFIARKI